MERNPFLRQQPKWKLECRPPPMEPLIQLLFQPSVEDVQQGFKRTSVSYKKAGEQLGITPYAIKRAVDAWLDGGMEAVRELKWSS